MKAIFNPPQWAREAWVGPAASWPRRKEGATVSADDGPRQREFDGPGLIG